MLPEIYLYEYMNAEHCYTEKEETGTDKIIIVFGTQYPDNPSFKMHLKFHIIYMLTYFTLQFSGEHKIFTHHRCVCKHAIQ